jgi:hypothetical protein
MSEQSGYIFDVFISYSHADSEWVRGELLRHLEEAKPKVMIDHRDLEKRRLIHGVY